MKGEYLRLGLVVGAAVTLVGHFATQSSSRSGGELLLFWLVLGLGVGFLVAYALERSTRRPEDELSEEGMTRTSTGELKAVIPTSSKFYAVSRKPSSSELRALMVDAGAVPGTPISTRLQLIVERYDAYSCLSLTEGSLLEYAVMEIAERALDEATSRMPAAAADVDFELVALQSNGPLNESGRSPFGWTFELVDGALGVACTVVLTDTDMLLLFGTAVSYPRGPKLEWMTAKKAMALVNEAVPETEGQPLYLQVEFPNAYFVVSHNPLALFAIDLKSSTMAAPELLPPFVPTTGDSESMSVADLLEMLEAEESSAMTEPVNTQNRRTIEAVASDMFRKTGPQTVTELSSAIERNSEDNQSIARILLNVLALVPSNLTVLALYRLFETLPPELESVAFSLFDKRRYGELGVDPDPLSDLSFEEVRALLGKTEHHWLALRSTYNAEGDLLPVLERLGLANSRVRLLSGDTELFLSAHFVTDDQRAEALLSSSPLPVPCHILRIVGPEADALAEQVLTSGLVYTDEQILEDVLSGRPYDVHRGALYQAAMKIDAHETFEALSQATVRHRTNIELRRAALAALAQLSCDGVNEFLTEVDDPDLLDMARLLLSQRGVVLPDPRPIALAHRLAVIA